MWSKLACHWCAQVRSQPPTWFSIVSSVSKPNNRQGFIHYLRSVQLQRIKLSPHQTNHWCSNDIAQDVPLDFENCLFMQRMFHILNKNSYRNFLSYNLFLSSTSEIRQERFPCTTVLFIVSHTISIAVRLRRQQGRTGFWWETSGFWRGWICIERNTLGPACLLANDHILMLFTFDALCKKIIGQSSDISAHFWQQSIIFRSDQDHGRRFFASDTVVWYLDPSKSGNTFSQPPLTLDRSYLTEI